jgi:hypothetical protein
MKLSLTDVVFLFVGAIAYFGVLYFVHQALTVKLRPWFRYLAVTLTAGAFFWGVAEYGAGAKQDMNFAKAGIAIAAAGCVFYEMHRKGKGRPIAERWKKVVGVALALAAITTYFDGYKFGYPPYWHRWDQYHYYMGAKYFPELEYKALYKCAVVAQDEVGAITYKGDRAFGKDTHPTQRVDMRAEMRDADKKIRDLPGENLLIPVGDILANKAECIDRFSPERWEQYKADVAFFRIVSGKGYWTDMQKDHGFNPPPVWTIAGKFFSDMGGASTVQYHQFLASLDILYLIGVFAALWWGFGWRVMAVGAIFWGTQSSAPFYWTGGALLRQDWLFFSVLSVAAIRRRHFKVAGASLVYAGLLRIFPGLVVVGTLVPVVAHVIRHKRMHVDHQKMLLGGCIAAAVLLPVSMVMSKSDPDAPFYQPYKLFYEHTIETHDRTPLTNHMGLRVIIGHQFFEYHKPGIRSLEERTQWYNGLSDRAKKLIGWTAPLRLPISLAEGPESGQMQHVKSYTRETDPNTGEVVFVRDPNALDPFQTWKEMRNERYDDNKPLAYGIILASLAFFVMVVHRIRSLWIAQCLGQIFIILGSQLTCYYYSFMILGAPLIKARRQVELGLFALAAVTQIIWLQTTYNDNRYTLLTIVSLLFCYLMLGMFARGDAWRRWLADKTGMEWLAPEDDLYDDSPAAPAKG